eukprot:g1251.t1
MMMMAMMDMNMKSEDRQLEGILSAIEEKVESTEASRGVRARVKQWVTKLREPVLVQRWKKNRNGYARLLLRAIPELTEPFSHPPPRDGPLPNLSPAQRSLLQTGRRPVARAYSRRKGNAKKDDGKKTVARRTLRGGGGKKVEEEGKVKEKEKVQDDDDDDNNNDEEKTHIDGAAVSAQVRELEAVVQAQATRIACLESELMLQREMRERERQRFEETLKLSKKRWEREMAKEREAALLRTAVHPAVSSPILQRLASAPATNGGKGYADGGGGGGGGGGSHDDGDDEEKFLSYCSTFVDRLHSAANLGI